MFEVAGEAYDRFMGRYSRGLSAQLVDLAHVSPTMRVLDVGCGPGALVGELVARLGPDLVAAVDPAHRHLSHHAHANPPQLSSQRRHYGTERDS